MMSLSAFSIKSQVRVKPKPNGRVSALPLEAPLDAKIAPQKDKGDDELSGAQLLSFFAAPQAFFDAEGF